MGTTKELSYILGQVLLPLCQALSSFTPSFHLYNPGSLGASYAAVCPDVSTDSTHAHTFSLPLSLGARELYLAHAQLPQIRKSN